MPFGGLDSDKPKEQCAGWGPGVPQGNGQFWEDIFWSTVKIGNLRREPCENGWADRDAVWEVDLLGVSNALHGGADWRHLENMIDWSVRGGDAALRQITSSTCYCYKKLLKCRAVQQLPAHLRVTKKIKTTASII